MHNSTFFYLLLFSLVGSVLSLAGGFILLGDNKFGRTLAKIGVPFAAGALLAAAFFDLLPEALESLSPKTVFAYVVAAILGFFVLEQYLHWFHHHDDHEPLKSARPLIIIGDTLHNFIDGIAIGAAFLISVPTGVITSIAIAAHEVPQEIGDFGVLLKSGMKPKRVIAVNVLSALATVLAAVGTYLLGHDVVLPTSQLLALTAGMFIYIAVSDLIPAIHNETKKEGVNFQVLILVAGLFIVALLSSWAHGLAH
jgi:zinc and cadmium transporter